MLRKLLSNWHTPILAKLNVMSLYLGSLYIVLMKVVSLIVTAAGVPILHRPLQTFCLENYKPGILSNNYFHSFL